jgi:hypothetical protein
VPQPHPPFAAELAVENNHCWYLAVLGAHGVPSRLEVDYWSADADAPLYYSQLVTRTRGAKAEAAQLRRIADLARRFAGRGWGIKDSYDAFAEGVLQQVGLRRLFRAAWYGWAAGERARAPGSLGASESGLELVPVQGGAALYGWEERWRGSSPAGAARIFPEALLAEPSVQLFTARQQQRDLGGFALNQSPGAIGLSNVFHDPELDPGVFVRDAARLARRLYPERAVVGYGPDTELESLAPLGFVGLGPLSVWVAQR